MRASEKSYFEGEGFVTVRHLSLHGTNFEIGRRLGEIAIQRHGKMYFDAFGSRRRTEAPQVGLEPTTLRLTVTLENSRNKTVFAKGYGLECRRY